MKNKMQGIYLGGPLHGKDVYDPEPIITTTVGRLPDFTYPSPSPTMAKTMQYVVVPINFGDSQMLVWIPAEWKEHPDQGCRKMMEALRECIAAGRDIGAL